MTRRLYYEDPYLTRFEAKVVKTVPGGVVLDQTAFFPTGGGQPNDLGTLNGISVTDVIEQGEDVVHVVTHPVEGEVTGVVDWDRRRDHMQQHHGQHILSEAFIRVCGAETTSFHLGAEVCTIDLTRTVAPIDVERAETLANMIVFENRPVQIQFYSPEEAKSLPVRKPPPPEPRIRIVRIPDFDCSPCCGTHPKQTGDVGVVMVVGLEGPRVYFVCGLRGLVFARKNADIVRAAGSKLSCSRDEILKSIDRVQTEGVAARKSLAAAERALAEYRAKDLAAAAPQVGKARLVVEIFADKDAKFLQVLANGIIEKPGMVAVLGASGEKSSLVVARSKDVPVDVRQILQDALAVIGGKGGGPPHFGQGGGDGKDIQGAVHVARERIVANLSV